MAAGTAAPPPKFGRTVTAAGKLIQEDEQDEQGGRK
ncbi:hypothetical protein L195_g062984 [Trifolium pratense]|uniref:Uncharacterized protein n=1 Tax=Trifolium pratense TaxID=57577 RepID=A0A2K3KJ16_TRIPR|nr:hypothetical protein L195_g062984 [Trifolium pratense]